MHVGELVRGLGPARLGIHLTQITQRIGAQTRKHQKTIDRQGSVPNLQQGLGLGTGVQVHVGPKHLHRVLGWQTFMPLGSTPVLHLPPRRLKCLSGGLCVRWGLSGQPYLRLGVTLLQGALCCQPATQWAPMHPLLRLQFDEVQPLLHARCHFFMQPGRLRTLHGQTLPTGSGDGVQRGGAKGLGHGAGVSIALGPLKLQKLVCLFCQPGLSILTA